MPSRHQTNMNMTMMLVIVSDHTTKPIQDLMMKKIMTFLMNQKSEKVRHYITKPIYEYYDDADNCVRSNHQSLQCTVRFQRTVI